MTTQERNAYLDKLVGLCNCVTPPLPKEGIDLAVTTMGKMWETIMEGKENHPGVMFIKNGKAGIMLTEFKDKHGGADKDGLAKAIRNLRTDCQAVCFGSECWMAQYTPQDADHTQPGYMRPRERADRKEVATAYLYIKERTVMFVAQIHRDPTRLDDWKVNIDTSKEGQGLTGRFA